MGNATTSMLDPAAFNNNFIDEVEHEFLYIHDPERIQEILNAKVCKADLRTDCSRIQAAKQGGATKAVSFTEEV